MYKYLWARIKDRRYLTLPETAEYVGISKEAILKAIGTQRLKAQQVDREWFIRKDNAKNFKKGRIYAKQTGTARRKRCAN